MPKKTKAKPEEVLEEAPVEETATEEEVVEATPETTKGKKITYPEVGGNGRFQMVPFGDGYVVYNPNGQRASNVVSLVEAKDLVQRNNNAAGLKG